MIEQRRYRKVGADTYFSGSMVRYETTYIRDPYFSGSTFRYVTTYAGEKEMNKQATVDLFGRAFAHSSSRGLRHDPALDAEIKAFCDMEADLIEKGHEWKWAVVFGGELIGTFDEYEEAAVYALRKFPSDKDRYLMRQIGVQNSHFVPSAWISHKKIGQVTYE